MNTTSRSSHILALSVLAAAALISACGGGEADPSAQASVEQKAAVAGDTRVKWNPGHYVALPGATSDSLLQTTLGEIAPYPQVKGVMLRYGWRQLEPTKGSYNFWAIDHDLSLIAPTGKRVFIMIGTKAFAAGAKAVPDYLYTDEYSGGAYKIFISGKSTIGSSDTYGENVALYDPDVRTRLIALNNALAQRYNLHNLVEGIAFNETALGTPLVPLTSTQQSDFFTNLAQVDAATRQAFPNTVVMQFINFPRPYMAGLVNSMVSSSVSLGGPDTFLTDYDLNNYIYPLYDVANTKVAVGPSVQAENYFTTSQNGAYAPPAISDLYGFAKDRLHANYIFWSRTMTAPLVPYNNVLNFFATTMPKDGAGGLATACPTTFASCVPRL